MTPAAIATARVLENGEQECDQEHRRVSARGPQQRAELLLLHHVPGNDGEDRAEAGERDVGGQRRRDQHEQQQVACNIPETGPRARARTLVAVRATVPVTQDSNVTARSRRLATSSQFERCLRPVIPSATTARAGFDRAQDRDRDRSKHGPHLGEVEGRERRRRQGPRQLAEATAHGGDVEMPEETSAPR